MHTSELNVSVCPCGPAQTATRRKHANKQTNTKLGLFRFKYVVGVKDARGPTDSSIQAC